MVLPDLNGAFDLGWPNGSLQCSSPKGCTTEGRDSITMDHQARSKESIVFEKHVPFRPSCSPQSLSLIVIVRVVDFDLVYPLSCLMINTSAATSGKPTDSVIESTSWESRWAMINQIDSQENRLVSVDHWKFVIASSTSIRKQRLLLPQLNFFHFGSWKLKIDEVR